jgi:hypothetical protein
MNLPRTFHKLEVIWINRLEYTSVCVMCEFYATLTGMTIVLNDVTVNGLCATSLLLLYVSIKYETGRAQTTGAPSS